MKSGWRIDGQMSQSLVLVANVINFITIINMTSTKMRGE
jgi:hypothetical protein